MRPVLEARIKELRDAVVRLHDGRKNPSMHPYQSAIERIQEVLRAATVVVAEYSEPSALICRSCGCTDNRPCPGGCAWAMKQGQPTDLCTACDPFVSAERLRHRRHRASRRKKGGRPLK